MDYQALLYGPIYRTFGVGATLALDAGAVALTVLDKTAGVTVGQAVEVQTVLPAAIVRATELAAAGVARAGLDGRQLAFNGKTWRIASWHAEPSPNGEDDGEVYLFLDGGQG